jgi:hypothetical protein
MTRVDAEKEWRAMLDYWALLVFGNNRTEVYRTLFMGLGIIVLNKLILYDVV